MFHILLTVCGCVDQIESADSGHACTGSQPSQCWHNFHVQSGKMNSYFTKVFAYVSILDFGLWAGNGRILGTQHLPSILSFVGFVAPATLRPNPSQPKLPLHLKLSMEVNLETQIRTSHNITNTTEGFLCFQKCSFIIQVRVSSLWETFSLYVDMNIYFWKEFTVLQWRVIYISGF